MGYDYDSLRKISVIVVPDLTLTDCVHIIGHHKAQSRCNKGSLIFYSMTYNSKWMQGLPVPCWFFSFLELHFFTQNKGGSGAPPQICYCHENSDPSKF